MVGIFNTTWYVTTCYVCVQVAGGATGGAEAASKAARGTSPGTQHQAP